MHSENPMKNSMIIYDLCSTVVPFKKPQCTYEQTVWNSH